MSRFGYTPMPRYALGNLGVPDFLAVRGEIAADLARLKQKYANMLNLGTWQDFLATGYTTEFYYPFDPATKGLPPWSVLQTGNLHSLDLKDVWGPLVAEVDRLNARFKTWGLLKDNAAEWQGYIGLLDELYQHLLDMALWVLDYWRNLRAQPPVSPDSESDPDSGEPASSGPAPTPTPIVPVQPPPGNPPPGVIPTITPATQEGKSGLMMVLLITVAAVMLLRKKSSSF